MTETPADSAANRMGCHSRCRGWPRYCQLGCLGGTRSQRRVSTTSDVSQMTVWSSADRPWACRLPRLDCIQFSPTDGSMPSVGIRANVKHARTAVRLTGAFLRYCSLLLRPFRCRSRCSGTRTCDAQDCETVSTLHQPYQCEGWSTPAAGTGYCFTHWSYHLTCHRLEQTRPAGNGSCVLPSAWSFGVTQATKRIAQAPFRPHRSGTEGDTRLARSEKVPTLPGGVTCFHDNVWRRHNRGFHSGRGPVLVFQQVKLSSPRMSATEPITFG